LGLTPLKANDSAWPTPRNGSVSLDEVHKILKHINPHATDEQTSVDAQVTGSLLVPRNRGTSPNFFFFFSSSFFHFAWALAVRRRK
jgi:hypothetical protein